MTFAINISPFIPHVIILMTFACLAGLLYAFRRTGRDRKNPLTSDLLRSPGETLRKRIDEVNENLNASLFMTFITPLLVLAVYFFLPKSKVRSDYQLILLLLVTLSFLAYLFITLWRKLKERRNLYLGFDCETAVGQELNQLMLQGCRVFHDVPAEKFNLDHVVVSSKGVFAVETKGRPKPDNVSGNAKATVEFDGDKLCFPLSKERKPLQQASSQARWLAVWLSSAVGEHVEVKPVLALPGWYVALKKPCDIIIYNGKNPRILLKGREDVLSESLMTRIVHQLDNRCRDVEPSAYQK